MEINMKRIKFFSILLLFICACSSAALAKPPMVEFFFVKYDGIEGLKRAEAAIKATGFKLIQGTYQGEDRVGIRGDYTAAIGCSTEYPTAVVFVVAGPNYDEAKRLARELQRRFLNPGSQ